VIPVTAMEEAKEKAVKGVPPPERGPVQILAFAQTEVSPYLIATTDRVEVLGITQAERTNQVFHQEIDDVRQVKHEMSLVREEADEVQRLVTVSLQQEGKGIQ
jgi:hypothetical protein